MVHEATLINHPTIFATIFPFHLPQMATFAIHISCSTSRLRHPPCTMHATTSPHTHTHTLGKVCVGPAAFQRRHQSIPHMPAVAPLATTWCPPVLLLANKHQWCCTASRVHREAASLRLCPHPPTCAAAPPECIKCRLQPLPRSHLSPASMESPPGYACVLLLRSLRSLLPMQGALTTAAQRAVVPKCCQVLQ